MSLTTTDYKLITARLLAKGYTPDTAFEALKASNFCVTIEGTEYAGIYASRVLAMMHEADEQPKPLEL